MQISYNIDSVNDDKKLSEIEANVTYGKMLYLEKNPIQGNFDIEHYKSVHKYLFKDLYNWAGEFRKVNISKKSTRFADCSKLEELCENCLSRISECDYFKQLAYDEFVDNIVDLYCTLNYLHPFREGNGRTHRQRRTKIAHKLFVYSNFIACVKIYQ